MADIKSINGNPIVPESVADGAVGVDGLAEDVVELLDNKADIDGYYSQLTAGLAENLIGRGDAVPAEYLYRTAGGTADIEDGIATIDCIKGNTLVWNQMYKHTKRPSTVTNGIDVVNNNDGSITLSGTATEEVTLRWDYNANFSITGGHKYLEKFCPPNGSSSTYFAWDAWGSRFNYDTGTGLIFTANADATLQPILKVKNGASINGTVYPQLFDLTLMFGAGNEPATVEEFEAMFPLPYYPYSAPKLLPVDIRGIETVGFNLWDEELEVGVYNSTTGAKSISTDYVRSANKIHVFPNMTYCFNVVDKSVTVYFYTYDESGAYRQTSIGISSGGTFVIPNGIHYFAFALKVSQYGSTTYQNDICINLSWSGYRNGEYEEYWNFQREIPAETYFPDGMRSAGSVADELTPNKAITRVKKLVLDGTQPTSWFGPLTTANENMSAWNLKRTNIPDVAYGTASIKNVVCDKLMFSPYAYTTWQKPAIRLWSDTSAGIVFAVAEGVTTSTQLLEWLAQNPLTIYYELAEPTEVTIDPPLNLSYKVSDFGTERIMVDETADAPQTAPVPMEVEYGINAIDTIRRLPTEYQSHKSMGQLTAALESSLGIDITETWDETEQRYEYEVSDFEIADGAVTPNSLSDEVLHGQYPSLSVGRADALTGADETSQWAQRVTEASGSATVRSVQGAAVAWNQWCRPQSFWTNNSTIATDDGVTTVTSTATSSLYFGMVPVPSPLKGFVPNHKYFVMADVDPSGITSSAFTGVVFNLGSYALTTLSGTNQLTQAGRLAAIVMSASTFEYASLYLTAQFNAMSDTSGQYFTASDIQCFDLTRMFGAGGEPSTAAEFQAMLLDQYYAYDTGTLKPVRIAGIRSTDAQGGELDAVSWSPFTLRGAGAIGDMLYSDHVETRVGVSDADANWNYGVSGPNENGIYYISMPTGFIGSSFITNLSSNLPISTDSFSQSTQREFACNTATVFYRFPSDHTPTMADALADLRANNAVCYYPTTPTTTPIIPALPMTYRVQQGGTESIIVPSGEISAAPIITVAEGESAADVVMDALACIATPDGPTATANHSVGTYLTMQGKLYKVTSAIASGESIVAGTNVTQTTVMAELIALTQ